MKTLLHGLSGATLSFCVASTLAAPTINNAGFETGDFTGWTLSGDADLNLVAPDLPNSGNYSGFFGQAGSYATLSQNLATEAGHSYQISFWLANLGASANNAASVSAVEVLTDQHSIWSLQDKTASTYTEYSVQFTATSNTLLTFSLRHDESYWLLDDISIRDVTSPVPEPASWLMLAGGLAALVLQRRRR